MSYILDALKKSEQQRQRGATPTLHSVQAAPAVPPTRRAWLYPALVVVLAAAAYAVGTMRPWQREPAPSAPSVAAVAPAPAQPAHDAAPAQPPAPSTHAAAQSDAAPTATDAVSSTGNPPQAMRAEPAASHAPPRAMNPPEAPVRKQAAVPTQAPARAPVASPHEEKILTLAELPAPLRAELPAMNVTVHSFSPTAKERLLGINNRLLREGDTLTPDLVLERITPDGMVFNFKGTRFQRGLR